MPGEVALSFLADVSTIDQFPSLEVIVSYRLVAVAKGTGSDADQTK